MGVVGGAGTCGKADVNFSPRIPRRASDEVGPLIKGNHRPRAPVAVIEVGASGTRRSVVELDEDKVEIRRPNGVRQMSIRYNTLRRAGDVVSLGNVQCEERTEMSNHICVVCVLIIRGRRWRDHGFNVEVEPVNYGSPKWSRTAPGGSLRSERSPEEVCEFECRAVVFYVVIPRICPAQREKDLFAK